MLFSDQRLVPDTDGVAGYGHEIDVLITRAHLRETITARRMAGHRVACPIARSVIVAALLFLPIAATCVAKFCPVSRRSINGPRR